MISLAVINTSLKLSNKKFIAMQIRSAAMQIVILQLQAEIISENKEKDYDEVYSSIMQSVERRAAELTLRLTE